MTKRDLEPFQIGTSAPTGDQNLTGQGSIMATIVSAGMIVEQQGPKGSIRPFGVDMGSKADESLLQESDRSVAIVVR